MKTRREAVKVLLSFLAGIWAFFGGLGSNIRLAIAETKRRLLKKGTPLESLTGQDPADLDASQLDTTPMDEFGTMGQSTYSISSDNWRLKVAGKVNHPSSLTYSELIEAPSVERNVLLICPGVFAYNGKWQGVSGKWLLETIGITAEATEIEFSGPKGGRGRTERFSLDEIRSDKIFLAYRVNGQPLPQKHGFPMRLVAEDHYGSRWVKFVDEIIIF